jgi:hypothetical protein
MVILAKENACSSPNNRDLREDEEKFCMVLTNETHLLQASGSTTYFFSIKRSSCLGADNVLLL